MTISRPTLPTALVVAVALTACGTSDTGGNTATSSGAGRATSVSPAAPSASNASRDGDVAFAQSMIPHHEQAIEMADLARDRATDAQVGQLAAQIKAAQGPEIQTMRRWLASWGADEDMGMDHSDHASMPGMMGQDELARLGAATGTDFDTLWLQMMIAHHEGALTMAQDVLTTTRDDAVRTLARSVLSGQTAEIDTMRFLLADRR